ncbi:MAG: hypothetical protein WC440_03780 [Candidatus Omnitrophota bacterium]|jgi:hypothetical protein
MNSNKIHASTQKYLSECINKKYGKLTVLRFNGYVDRKDGKRSVVVFCKCECGNVIERPMVNIKRGHVLSCGCRHKKHGEGKTALYSIWNAMIQRCYHKYNKAYKNYGMRGITVCDEWLNDFLVFREWALTNGYGAGLEIDRIDNNRNYEPINCRFTTHLINNRNKRTNVISIEIAKKIRQYKIQNPSFTNTNIASFFGIPPHIVVDVLINKNWN